jgi:hypothetical protein
VPKLFHFLQNGWNPIRITHLPGLLTRVLVHLEPA